MSQLPFASARDILAALAAFPFPLARLVPKSTRKNTADSSFTEIQTEVLSKPDFEIYTPSVHTSMLWALIVRSMSSAPRVDDGPQDTWTIAKPKSADVFDSVPLARCCRLHRHMSTCVGPVRNLYVDA